MSHPLALLGFALTTGFALTVDVGLYAIVHFATTQRARSVLRFATEIATAHAALLVVGALIAELLARSFGSDVLVDIVSAIALTIVIKGAFERAVLGPHLEPGSKDAPRTAFAWFTAFALSLDALLVAPSANEFVGDVALPWRLYALLLLFLGVFVFAFFYAAFAKKLRDLVLNRTAESRRRRKFFAVASAAELAVFSMFFAIALFGVLEHLVLSHPVPDALARAVGIGLGILLFVVARARDGGDVAPREVDDLTNEGRSR